MTVRFAVVDPLPLYARGLAATLNDAGYPTDLPEDLLGWVRRPGDAAVLLTVLDEAEWGLLHAVRQVSPDTRVLAVVGRADTSAHLRAVAAGAVAVLARDAAPPLVLDVLREALAGRSVLPTEVLQDLVRDRAPDDHRPASADEIGWLRELATGATVTQLAERVGYSERMIYRRLAGLYDRLGVSSRTQAIVRARDEGWL